MSVDSTACSLQEGRRRLPPRLSKGPCKVGDWREGSTGSGQALWPTRKGSGWPVPGEKVGPDSIWSASLGPSLVCPGPCSEALALLVVSPAAQLLPEKNLRQSLLPKLSRYPLPSGHAGRVFPIKRVTLELKWELQEPHRLTDFDHAID